MLILFSAYRLAKSYVCCRTYSEFPIFTSVNSDSLSTWIRTWKLCECTLCDTCHNVASKCSHLYRVTRYIHYSSNIVNTHQCRHIKIWLLKLHLVALSILFYLYFRMTVFYWTSSRDSCFLRKMMNTQKYDWNSMEWNPLVLTWLLTFLNSTIHAIRFVIQLVFFLGLY